MIGVTYVVWMDGWQLQCCGDAFAVGDRVTWSLREASDTTWLEAALGPDRARSVTHDEDHHTDGPDSSASTRGRVTSIERGYCRYAPTSQDPRVLMPVPGTALIDRVSRADGWEPEIDGRMFSGYLVTLDVDPAVES